MESQNIEYKQTWKDDYLKWVCGFANAQGGSIFIGIDDKGKVCGVDNAKKLIEDIPNKINNILGIVADVNLLKKDGLDYIEATVEASNVPVSFRGKYYYRSGSTLQELNGSSLQQFVMKKMGRSWDDIPNDRATLDDIDRKAIDYFLKKGIEASRIPDDQRDATTKDILTNLHLINEDGQLKNAALLLFGKDPLKFFSSVRFKIGRFGVNEGDLLIQDVIEGNIIQMADRVMEILTAKYLASPIRFEGMQRIEELEVPKAALREILYNAIAHKDYTGPDIQMHVYNDHIEVWNEGELPEGYDEKVLYGKHSSKPRNRNIADTMFKAGFIDTWGRGYSKISDGFKDAGLPIPTVAPHCGGTLVTIPRGYDVVSGTQNVTSNVTNDVTNGGNNGGSDVGSEIPDNETINTKVNDSNVGSDVTNDVTNHVTNGGNDGGNLAVIVLTENQKNIYKLVKDNSNITVKQMAVTLAVSKRTLERDLADMQKKGILMREGSPNSGHWILKVKVE